MSPGNGCSPHESHASRRPIPPGAAVTTATCRTPLSGCSTPCAVTRCRRLTCAKVSTHGRPNACNLCHLDQTLAWTADNLHAWYQQPMPDLSEDDKTISAAVQWLVKGDAGQRALLAWGMGWEPAQKISGRDWLYPFLSYSSARSLCRGSLRCLEIVADLARDSPTSNSLTQRSRKRLTVQ